MSAVLPSSSFKIKLTSEAQFNWVQLDGHDCNGCLPGGQERSGRVATGDSETKTSSETKSSEVAHTSNGKVVGVTGEQAISIVGTPCQSRTTRGGMTSPQVQSQGLGLANSHCFYYKLKTMLFNLYGRVRHVTVRWKIVKMLMKLVIAVSLKNKEQRGVLCHSSLSFTLSVLLNSSPKQPFCVPCRPPHSPHSPHSPQNDQDCPLILARC